MTVELPRAHVARFIHTPLVRPNLRHQRFPVRGKDGRPLIASHAQWRERRNPLTFDEWYQEQQRPRSESGYLGTSIAERGSPYIASTQDANGMDRMVVLAIHLTTSTFDFNVTYVDNAQSMCRMTSSKVDEGLVDLIHLLSI